MLTCTCCTLTSLPLPATQVRLTSATLIYCDLGCTLCPQGCEQDKKLLGVIFTLKGTYWDALLCSCLSCADVRLEHLPNSHGAYVWGCMLQGIMNFDTHYTVPWF